VDDLSQIRPNLALGSGVSQQVGGVKRRHDGQASLIQPELPSDSSNAFIHTEEPAYCRSAEGDDDLGSEELNLAFEIRGAFLDLALLRFVVLRRAALDDVADVNLIEREAHRKDHLVEKFPCGAAKGFP